MLRGVNTMSILQIPIELFKKDLDLVINEMRNTGKDTHVECEGFELIVVIQFRPKADDTQYPLSCS